MKQTKENINKTKKSTKTKKTIKTKTSTKKYTTVGIWIYRPALRN